jgi:ribonuclease T2
MSRWSSLCQVVHSPSSQRRSAQSKNIMGSGGIEWHQWKKHKICSGLSSKDYFEILRQAYLEVNRPVALRQLENAVELKAETVEKMFLKANVKLNDEIKSVVRKANFISIDLKCILV